MSSSSQPALFYTPETTYKQLPATPAFKPLSHTACTLALTKAVMESKEINGTRQMTSVLSN